MDKNPSNQRPRERKLAAIMFTDIVGYTAMMQEDEEKAVKIRERHREIFDATTDKYNGRILQYYGDGTLSIFDSAIDAVSCATEMQVSFQQWPQIPVRIGIHMGDIIFSDEEIIGDGVNIASRIESLGVAGSVLISDRIREEIENQRQIQTKSLGHFDLKNVNRPFEVFAISKGNLVVPEKGDIEKKKVDKDDSVKNVKTRFRNAFFFLLGAAILVLAGLYLPEYLGREEPGENEELIGKSIAVLPFVNLSGDPEQEYFSDGITEEILNALTKIEGLKVASRTSSFSFKGSKEDLLTIAQKLNVATILEGSVRKSGENVRITAQLINVSDGFHLWSENYDREMNDIFAIQDDISNRIANKMRLSLVDTQVGPSGNVPTNDMEAYEQVLKGHYFLRQRHDGVYRALEYFQNAVKLDPEYAAAYESLARSYMLIASFGNEPASETIPKAKDAIQISISLNPSSAQAHRLLAEIHMVYDWDWDAARNEYDQAIAFGYGTPSLFEAFYEAAINNDLEEAITMTIQLSHNDPLNFNNLVDLANFYSWNGQYTEARAVTTRILELDPGYGEAYAIRGESYMHEGNREEAISSLEKAAELWESMSWLQEMLVPFIKNLDNDEILEGMYQQLEESAASDQVPIHIMFNSYGFTGRNDDAFRWLEKGIEERTYYMYRLQVNPWLKNLHNDPRWEEILKKVGFPATRSE
jgi:TolB-like protein/class 3 adenylate cyclase/Tfp pilus assembly protein PilF